VLSGLGIEWLSLAIADVTVVETVNEGIGNNTWTLRREQPQATRGDTGDGRVMFTHAA